MFKTAQALPLRKRRTWCPRMSRGGCAEFPRNISHSWTWQRPVHGPDSARNRTRTGTFHDGAQSMLAFSPRQQSWPRTIHVHAQTTALIVREQTAATDAKCPQTVRSRDLSASVNSSRLQSICKLGLAENCPRHRIIVSVSPPIQFAIRVRIIPSHVLI